MASKYILIVEDDEDIQAIYRQMILDTYADVDIGQKFNGAEGVKAVEERIPDLIVLDLLMPIMDGEQFLDHLRHKMNQTKIPVLICSVNQPLAKKLVKSGAAEATLPKFFQLQELVKVIDQFVHIQPKPNAPGIS